MQLTGEEIKLLDPDKANRCIFILNKDEKQRIEAHRKEQKRIKQNRYYKLLLSI